MAYKIKSKPLKEKKYQVMYGVGKAKYVVNFSDGSKRYSDDSEFFDIKIFKDKKDLEEFKKNLKSKGYKEE